MRTSSIALLAAGALAGCTTNEPAYLSSPQNLEAGVLMDAKGNLIPGTSSLTLPIKPETAADKTARDALTAKLGVQVPYVKVGDLAVSLAWTIKNLDGNPGQAEIGLDGANELFVYDPGQFPTARDAPPPPDLQGDIPIDVPANGTVSGEFREDQVLEASIDVDVITRGNLVPYAATLQTQKDLASFQPMTPPNPADPNYTPMPLGPAIPRAAFPQIVTFNLVFNANTHMVLEYTVRVRDLRGNMMHPMGLAAPMAEVTQFTPMLYKPAPPMPPP
jgi:hypothetical protein